MKGMVVPTPFGPFSNGIVVAEPLYVNIDGSSPAKEAAVDILSAGFILSSDTSKQRWFSDVLNPVLKGGQYVPGGNDDNNPAADYLNDTPFLPRPVHDSRAVRPDEEPPETEDLDSFLADYVHGMDIER